MNNTVQINRESAPFEALATAAVKVLLKFLTSQSINILLAAVALVSLLSWLITGQHATVAIFATVVWVCHFAAMAAIDIAKGGDQL